MLLRASANCLHGLDKIIFYGTLYTLECCKRWHGRHSSKLLEGDEKLRIDLQWYGSPAEQVPRRTWNVAAHTVKISLTKAFRDNRHVRGGYFSTVEFIPMRNKNPMRMSGAVEKVS